ncbi:endonuclease NucS domain-containing protein [Crassaminicella thermophila]|nr:endonuclease NucS domain-containing protein [Crassaminicella thermophila]
MQRQEEKIRDYLSENLQFISEDLTFIEKEYLLQNKYGTKGFIDILAKDRESNYVIIEIKRSKQASRQALHEISKYAALLKQNLKIKDSELRLIIISTTWEELLVPFSEFYYNENYFLEGYLIELDENNIPIKRELIKPLQEFYKRQISRSHNIFLYSDNDKLEERINDIEKLLPLYGINDFIILQLSTNKKIPYPHALYLVHQRYSEDFYLDLLKRMQYKKEFENLFYSKRTNVYDEALEQKKFYQENPDEDIENYYIFLEGIIFNNINAKIESDSFEIGYPEKFLNIISESWTVDNIIKHGLFLEDNRFLSKEVLIETMGLDGNNQIMYFNYTHSRHKAKLDEIFKESLAVFYGNKVWKYHIINIYEKLKREKRDYRLSIMIYNPERIFESVINNLEPGYEIFIEYNDDEKTIEFYRGIIKWNRGKADFKDIINKYFERDEFKIFFEMHFGTIRNKDLDIMKELGLNYKTECIFSNKDKEVLYDFDVNYGDIILYEKSNTDDNFYEFIDNSNEFINELKECFNRNTYGFVNEYYFSYDYEDIFICYMDDDEENANKLSDYLKSKGLNIYLCKLDSSDSIYLKLLFCLKKACLGIVIMSFKFMQNKHWLEELERFKIFEESSFIKLLPVFKESMSEEELSNIALEIIKKISVFRGTQLVMPPWEDAYYRFLQGEGELKVYGGGVCNIFEAIAHFTDEEFPLILKDRIMDKHQLLSQVYQLLSDYEYTGKYPSLYFIGTTTEIRDKVWEQLYAEFKLDRPKGL